MRLVVIEEACTGKARRLSGWEKQVISVGKGSGTTWNQPLKRNQPTVAHEAFCMPYSTKTALDMRSPFFAFTQDILSTKTAFAEAKGSRIASAAQDITNGASMSYSSI